MESSAQSDSNGPGSRGRIACDRDHYRRDPVGNARRCDGGSPRGYRNFRRAGAYRIHSGTLPGRPGIKREVKFIVIHETGNPSEGADAKAHSDYLLNGGEGTTSWHYTVDDHEIYHHIPDSEVSWNAGDRRQEPGGNMNGISIELCVNQDGDFEKPSTTVHG